MERFIIQPSENPGYWVCTDQINLVMCIFKEHDFNYTQQFQLLEDFDTANAQKLATYAREMGDWLRENHYEKVF